MTWTPTLGALGCSVLVSLAACGEDGVGGESAAAARTEQVSAAPPPEVSAPAPLSPGRSVRVSLESGALVSAFASLTARRDVLNALADAAGFTLAVGPEVELDQPFTLHVEREPLEVTLARVLVGVPHALYYEKDPASGAPRLERVTVGIEWTRLAEATASPPRCSECGADRATVTPLRAEPLENLESEDEALRRKGVTRLDVRSSEGFEAAANRLANDESPLVRVAAAETLVGSDADAIPPLLQALADPDPRVVLAALQALEFVGDASVVPALSRLLGHRDDEVRERTLEAIELLE
jgi:hypothetical protein